jgi:hypothetical protein
LSQTLTQVQALVARGAVRVSGHGYDELANDAILITEILDRVTEAIVVEDYPDAIRGPTVLVLQRDAANEPVHVVWGIPKGRAELAVLVTAYRPQPELWSSDFVQRKPK